MEEPITPYLPTHPTVPVRVQVGPKVVVCGVVLVVCLCVARFSSDVQLPITPSLRTHPTVPVRVQVGPKASSKAHFALGRFYQRQQAALAEQVIIGLYTIL